MFCGDKCLDISRVCDGHADCPAAGDEGGNCTKLCTHPNTNPCEQNCHPTPQGAACSCSQGFTLEADGRTCTKDGEVKRVFKKDYWANTFSRNFTYRWWFKRGRLEGDFISKQLNLCPRIYEIFEKNYATIFTGRHCIHKEQHLFTQKPYKIILFRCILF